ncbi:hypothetical protein RJT34_04179 [Clitoria ternatea]|uniref:Uncharacterized protein n=1 Tax=Clitoria ternatea TaxID=43366 RepID=A0AAN9Q5V3_CLITE
MVHDTHENGEVQYQKFPSKSPKGRVLWLKGRDTHDGSWNSYALACPEGLPYNTTFMEGLAFVSYNHYNYDHRHGLSAMVPFVAWHKMNNCPGFPQGGSCIIGVSLDSRWAFWLGTLMEATFNGPQIIERFDGVGEESPVCFEEAVVMRHTTRVACQGIEGWRTGPRSFKNETIVAEIFHKECAKIKGFQFMVAHSIISPFVSSWSGMKHEGSWRDPSGDDCPYSEDDRRCMSIDKNGRIGHNACLYTTMVELGTMKPVFQSGLEMFWLRSRQERFNKLQ